MTEPAVGYEGKDLEAMDGADAYRAWILDLFKPYLGKRIVEVGAGIGSFSKLLLETSPEKLTLVEPSAMFDRLRNQFGEEAPGTRVKLYNQLFSDVAGEIRIQEPDSIIYINVLEHIEDDIGELGLVRETLAPKGRLFLFVPALPFLYSKLDRHIGHFRRYGRSELREKVADAGFRILELRWFDMLGIAPWLVKYRLFGSMTVEAAAVRAYDSIAVPLIRPLENFISPPIGKNLLLIAERD
ncbi:MAG: class I SAM-dependent methyltransferase [Pyrinomonadaceae bacterium]